jgi:hypothetical protein
MPIPALKTFSLILFLALLPLPGKAADGFFLKTNVGTTYLQAFITYDHNPLYYNGLYATTYITQDIEDAAFSLEAGFDCPDGFSYYLGWDLLPMDRTLLANIRFTLLGLDPVRPYVFFGLGGDLSCRYGLGFGGQWGAGLGFLLSPGWELALETKEVVGVGFSDPVDVWINAVAPLTLGLKVTP